jgi:hypothetical protein
MAARSFGQRRSRSRGHSPLSFPKDGSRRPAPCGDLFNHPLPARRATSLDFFEGRGSIPFLFPFVFVPIDSKTRQLANPTQQLNNSTTQQLNNSTTQQLEDHPP